MTHYLKLNYKYCDAVYSGNKNFELRYNDRNYKVGDNIIFKPIYDDKSICTHAISNKQYEITYILESSDYIDLDGYVILGIHEKE